MNIETLRADLDLIERIGVPMDNARQMWKWFAAQGISLIEAV